MEKAILKTLIYADIFDYPLKAYEIHKWLISPPAGRTDKNLSFKQVEKALIKLIKKQKVKNKKGYFFLVGRDRIIQKRLNREKQSKTFFFKAKFCTWFLKVIPTLKLVGISGGLALSNADERDDIDLFLVTSENRLWLTRFLSTIILDFLGVRRKVNMKQSQVSGKLCLNILLEEEKLEQENKDIFVAHEVLQMKVLWERSSSYKKYLEKNSWAFEYLPNWMVNEYQASSSKYYGKNKDPLNTKYLIHNTANLLENLAKWIQLKVMQKPKGMERIQDKALYFHPKDVREEILKQYKLRIKKLSNT